MDLVEEVYRLAALLPKEERFCLSDQIRRSSVSIPSNIAEGYGRKGQREYVRFLNISRGSEYELETQLLLCVRLGYLTDSQIKTAFDLCDEIGKMLNAIISKLSPTPSP